MTLGKALLALLTLTAVCVAFVAEPLEAAFSLDCAAHHHCESDGSTQTGGAVDGVFHCHHDFAAALAFTGAIGSRHYLVISLPALFDDAVADGYRVPIEQPPRLS